MYCRGINSLYKGIMIWDCAMLLIPLQRLKLSVMLLSISLSKIFFLGGIFPMILLTILLATIFFAAWKAPRWVENIGSIALALSVLFTAYNFVGAASAVIETEGDIHPVVIWGGTRCAAVLLAYGLFVFIVSRFIDMIQKPRI